MTKRLNARLRGQIITSVVSATLRERKDALRERKVKIAEAILADVLNGYADAFNKLPKRLVPIENAIQVNLAGRAISLPLAESKRVPQCIFPNGYHGYSTAYDARHTFSKTFDGIDNESGAIKAAEKDLGQKLKQFLDPLSTVKQALDLWPELEHMMPVSAFEQRAQVPAVLVADLQSDIEKARKG